MEIYKKYIEGKSYRELHEIRHQSHPGSDVYMQVTEEIRRIQQDTNYEQIAKLISETQTLKKLTEANSDSSKRFAKSSILIAIIALVSTLAIGCVQIYLASIQALPVFQSIAKEEKEALAFCLQNTDSYWNHLDGSTTTCIIILKKQGALLNQQMDLSKLMHSWGFPLLATSTLKLR